MTSNLNRLTIEDLTVRTTERTILDQLTLTVPAGTLLVVTGPAGSGKSTLLATLAGVRPPTSGRILLDEQPITSPSAQQRIGYLPQTVAVLDALTAAENVALPLLARAVPADTAWQQTEQLLDQLGVPAGARHNLAEQLSGGQRQRVAFARTTIHHPTLLIADDPTSELDTDTAQRTLQLIRDTTTDRRTAIIATTDPTIAAAADEHIRLGARQDEHPGRHASGPQPLPRG